MARFTPLIGLVLFAPLAVAACASTPDAVPVSGTVVTYQPIRVAHEPGDEPQPIPNPRLTDDGWNQMCKGNRVLMDGSTRWYYAPDGELTGLEGSQATIKDAQGEIVGLPCLTFSAGENARSGGAFCSWSFTIDDFKSEADFFTIEIEGVPGGREREPRRLAGGPRALNRLTRSCPSIHVPVFW